MMHLDKLMEKRVFDFKFVFEMLGKRESLAKNTLQRYLRKGYIKRVKRNLYVAISFESGGVIADRYEIASNITKSAHVSHHSAFEVYGYANQVYNTVYVSSNEQFRDFKFEGITYKYIYCSKKEVPVEIFRGTKVSTLARTIVDSINAIKSYDDMEELIENMKAIPLISGIGIYDYLIFLNKKILFNKVGLILSFFVNDISVTKEHLTLIKERCSKLTKDFTTEKHRLSKYYKEWYMHCYDINRFMEV